MPQQGKKNDKQLPINEQNGNYRPDPSTPGTDEKPFSGARSQDSATQRTEPAMRKVERTFIPDDPGATS